MRHLARPETHIPDDGYGILGELASLAPWNADA
jgi:hypothetical protein